MTLGEKMRQARLDAGLSQKALCGEKLTRNMLSLIESGSAKPSMGTLQYLAQRLGKPVSYFLDEESPARQAYIAGDYALAMEEAQQDVRLSEQEKYLLLALSALALARQVGEEKPAYGEKLLQQALQAMAQTPYATNSLRREALLLHYRINPKQVRAIAPQLPDNTEELLLRSEAALLAGDGQLSRNILMAAPVKNTRWYYQAGKAEMSLGHFSQAAEFFLQAEREEPLLCAKALEECYREMGDYQKAYFYACKQRQQEL